MKKLIAMVLALVMVASMVACTSKKDETPAEDPNQIVTEAPTEGETETPETPAEGEDAETETPAEGEDAEAETPAEGEETTAEDAPAEEEVQLSPEAAELMEKLNQLVEGLPEDLLTQEAEVTPDMFEYYTFVPQVEGAVAVVSEPMIGSIAHSVVLVKLPEGADAAAFAADVDANKKPNKWVCVEAEESYVKTSGQYVLLVMSDKEMAGTVAANWDTVFGA